MNSVFVVQHVYEVEPCGHDESKFIGVYSTRQSAESATKRLSLQPGFKSKPDCFFICEYKLDEDHWMEGFISTK